MYSFPAFLNLLFPAPGIIENVPFKVFNRALEALILYQNYKEQEILLPENKKPCKFDTCKAFSLMGGTGLGPVASCL
jgi:hypothetical protein